MVVIRPAGTADGIPVADIGTGVAAASDDSAAPLGLSAGAEREPEPSSNSKDNPMADIRARLLALVDTIAADVNSQVALGNDKRSEILAELEALSGRVRGLVDANAAAGDDVTWPVDRIISEISDRITAVASGAVTVVGFDDVDLAAAYTAARTAVAQ